MDGSGQLWTAVVRMLDSCCTCVCAISTYILCNCMLICAMGMCTIVLVPACAWRAPCLSKCHAREAAERTSGCRRECESMCAVCLHAIEIAHRPIFVKHTSSGVLLHAHRVHTVHKYICLRIDMQKKCGTPRSIFHYYYLNSLCSQRDDGQPGHRRATAY